MALTNFEKETIINFNESETEAIVYTHNVELRKKLKKFADKTTDCKIKHEGRGFAEFIIPKGWVTIEMPKKLSESEKKAVIARAKEKTKAERRKRR